ncbi:ChbG/HpnK family deacetylase [Candidatus Poribacteria bacterium]|nr:ChbG/HpnK family deacetylase [Candidatus Poribacteria bacterium]
MEHPRWGPVLGPAKVPSLVMKDSTFFKTTQTLWENNPDNHEIIAELKSQLDTARLEGLNIEYMDTHMGFSWF